MKAELWMGRNWCGGCGNKCIWWWCILTCLGKKSFFLINFLLLAPSPGPSPLFASRLSHFCQASHQNVLYSKSTTTFVLTKLLAFCSFLCFSFYFSTGCFLPHHCNNKTDNRTEPPSAPRQFGSLSSLDRLLGGSRNQDERRKQCCCFFFPVL